jgi:ERCC4-related helicase
MKRDLYVVFSYTVIVIERIVTLTAACASAEPSVDAIVTRLSIATVLLQTMVDSWTIS